MSLASAKQRRGRAGRVRPGACFKLFSRCQAARMQVCLLRGSSCSSLTTVPTCSATCISLSGPSMSRLPAYRCPSSLYMDFYLEEDTLGPLHVQAAGLNHNT